MKYVLYRLREIIGVDDELEQVDCGVLFGEFFKHFADLGVGGRVRKR